MRLVFMLPLARAVDRQLYVTVWQKSKGAPRTLHIEYVGPKGTTVMKLDSERCVPTSVLPLGESGTTRITLTCGSLRAS